MDSISIHKKLRGKIEICPKARIKSAKDLSVLYTPGVADPCRKIAEDKSLAYEYTMKGNSVAIVTDGSRVLGLGNIGPEAALPVMEGKALIMQQFAGLDAFPICLNTRDENEIVAVIKSISPVFGAINLEDIETPKVFRIEKRLAEDLEIPVFHDDQHGTAMVALAGLYNSLNLLDKNDSVKIGLIGSGSAGYGIAKLLWAAGFRDLVVFDSKGAIHRDRELQGHKKEMAAFNSCDYQGPIESFSDADVIISAARPGALPSETIKNMNKPNVVFALSNPISEISLDQGRFLGIDVFGTGRSDYPNQINNASCFPGFLKALLELRITRITDEMKIAAAKGIAECVENPTKDRIIPDPFDPALVSNILKRMREVA